MADSLQQKVFDERELYKKAAFSSFCSIPLSLQAVSCDASTPTFYDSIIDQSSILQR